MVKENDLVLCTVERITNTTVFVKLQSGEEGTLVISEIAPGRIKNLREYVTPNKKIVCKVLKNQNNHIELSLRRVSSKEKAQIMQEYKKEKTLESAFTQILEKPKETKDKIKKDFPTLSEFAKQAKENPKLIEEYISDQEQDKIKKVIDKRQKKSEIRKTIELKCLEDNGIEIIKGLIKPQSENQKTTYISAGKFLITLKGDDQKKTDRQMESLLENIKSEAKKKHCDFNILQK